MAPVQKKIYQNNLLIGVDGLCLEKLLKELRGSIFDYPIITTNSAYLDLVKKYLNKIQ